MGANDGWSHTGGPNPEEGPPTLPDPRVGQWHGAFSNQGVDTTALGFGLSTTSSGTLASLVTSWRRIWFQFPAGCEPSANDTCFCTFGNSTNCVALTIDIDGTIKARNLGSVTAYPGELIATLGVITFGRQWHVVDAILVGKTAGPAGGGSVTINFDNANTISAWGSSITSGNGQGIGFWNGSTGMRVSQDVVGRSQGAGGDVNFGFSWANWVGDDNTAYLSTASRIFAARVAGQGTYNDFGGNIDWRERNRLGDQITSVAATSSTTGHVQSWLMQTLANLGVGSGTSIQSAVVNAYFSTQPFSQRPDLLIRRNGVDTFITINYAAQSGWFSARLDTTGWSNLDSIEIGFRMVGTQTLGVQAVMLTVEAEGELVEAGHLTDYKALAMEWTGTGASQFVNFPVHANADGIIWWPRNNSTRGGFMFKRWIGGHYLLGGAGTIDDLRFTEDGLGIMLIGARAGGPNISTVVYDGLLIYDQVGRIVAQGHYHDVSTAGRDNRDIPVRFGDYVQAGVVIEGEALQADAILAANENFNSAAQIMYRGPGSTGTNSHALEDNNAPSADKIQAIGVGTWNAGQTINAANSRYHTAFLALRQSGWWDVPLMAFTSYVGNGAGGTRDITFDLGGNAPAWAIVLPIEASDFGVIKGPNHALGRNMNGTGATVANSITAVGADSITVGSALNVNLRVYSVWVMALGEDTTPPDTPQQQITQTFLEVLTDEDADADAPPGATGCVGGGTVDNGVNFTDGESLATATQIHVWIELTIGATVYRWAKVALNADERKQPRVLSFGRLVRALTGPRGGFETPAVEIMLSDVDRLLRGLHDAGTLQNAIGKIYMADITTIQSAASPPPDPWLLFVGVVRDFRPEGGLQYSITLEDKLTYAFGAFGQERKLPETLVDDRISDQNPLEKVHGIPVPLLYGALSDEDQDEPEGTIPCPMINAITLSGHESLGNIYRFLVGKGVTADLQSVFRADPDSGDPPTERSKAAASEYGDKLWAPHQTDWIYAPDNFDLIDEASRFTFVYMDQTHPGAELARQGRIPLAVNCCGYDTVGDGTGDTIDSLPLQLLHFLNNFVAQSALLDWLGIASLDGTHSLFDTTSFETVKDITEDRIAGGYVGAFLIGHSRKQITLREVLAQFCRSGDFDLGVNRYGQLFITMLDRLSTASGASVFTAQDDILEGTFRIDPHADEIENRIRYVYRRRYVETLQQLNPAEGAPGLREPFDAEWISGELVEDDEGAQTALGQVRESERLELEMVRDQTTAEDVVAQRLARLARARAEATFTIRCNRGMLVELGDIVKVTHFGGIGSSGWTARRCQVRRHEVDLDALTVTITARDVHDLMA